MAAYDGYSEARKRANKKYMEKIARVVLWCTPEEKRQIEADARAEGKSVNQYIKDKLLPHH